jgi:hypothetical protein
MAVLSVKERHERRRSSYRDGKTTHTRIFLVELQPSDVPNGTAIALTADDGFHRVPGPGDYYNGIPFSGKDAEPVPKSIAHFEVTVEHSGPGDPEQDDVHPLDRPPEVSFGSDGVTEPYFKDKSDPPKPVANSATEAPDQFFERDRGYLTIQFVRNVDYWDAVEMDGYSNTINEDGVYIDGSYYEPETLKLSPPTAARQVETIRINGQPTEVVYYRATFGLKHNPDGWKDKMLDVGYSELIERQQTVSGQTQLVKQLVPIYDKAAGTLRKPWPLDGLGRKRLSPADPAAELEFLPYTKRSWSALYF